MVSVVTGMIFTLLITRNSTAEEYGVWSNVFDLMAYFTLLASVLPFWMTRFVARGEQGAAKTGIVANLLISLLAAAIYIPFVPIITSMLNISEELVILYFIATLEIIELYLLNAFEACLRAERPQAVGYGLLVAEVCKIALAYLIIVNFHQPLQGALLGLITGILVQVLYYTKLVAKDFKQKIRWGYVAEWLKGSVATIYNVAGTQLAAFIFILLIKYGGEAAKGNYAAAATIANIITYSTFLSFALYPKLLMENSTDDVRTSLKTVLMFAIPMAAGAMAIPGTFLRILAPGYSDAAPVLFLLAPDALVMALTTFFTFTVFGVERFDEKAKIPLKQLVKSNIFKLFSLTYIHSAITLPTTFYVLTTFEFSQPWQAALYVTIINMTARFAMFLILCLVVRRSMKVSVPWKNIAKYLLAAVIMAIALYFFPQPTLTSALATAAMGLAMAVTGGVLYLALLMVIDKDARSLIRVMLDEIKTSLRRTSN